jgi:hypothetical protein
MVDRPITDSLKTRIGRWLRRPLLQSEAKLDAVLDQLAHTRGELGDMARALAEVNIRVGQLEVETARVAGIARHIYDQEPDNRRRLHALRASDDYELAFAEEEPLVSIIVPTYTSYETLRDVALPSLLNQSYANIEVIVVGDCAPPETERVIAEVGDSRVTYLNRTIRGPYPEDPAKRWYPIGGPPFNDGLALARGRWVGALGDDDAVRPRHTECLLAAARENRWEQCYGRQLVHFAEGETLELGKFPPELGQWGTQAALWHSGLRFFESELADAIYDEPSDWSKCRRMIRAGVRIGMVDEVVVDKNETRRRSAEEWETAGAPEAG